MVVIPDKNEYTPSNYNSIINKDRKDHITLSIESETDKQQQKPITKYIDNKQGILQNGSMHTLTWNVPLLNCMIIDFGVLSQRLT